MELTLKILNHLCLEAEVRCKIRVLWLNCKSYHLCMTSQRKCSKTVELHQKFFERSFWISESKHNRCSYSSRITAMNVQFLGLLSRATLNNLYSSILNVWTLEWPKSWAKSNWESVTILLFPFNLAGLIFSTEGRAKSFRKSSSPGMINALFLLLSLYIFYINTIGSRHS